MHLLLCNLFVFFIFFFVSLTVIAGKEINLLESQKKNYDDKNVHIAIYAPSKSYKKNIIYSKNGIIFYSFKNGLLKLPEKKFLYLCLWFS